MHKLTNFFLKSNRIKLIPQTSYLNVNAPFRHSAKTFYPKTRNASQIHRKTQSFKEHTSHKSNQSTQPFPVCLGCLWDVYTAFYLGPSYVVSQRIHTKFYQRRKVLTINHCVLIRFIELFVDRHNKILKTMDLKPSKTMSNLVQRVVGSWSLIDRMSLSMKKISSFCRCLHKDQRRTIEITRRKVPIRSLQRMKQSLVD